MPISAKRVFGLAKMLSVLSASVLLVGCASWENRSTIHDMAQTDGFIPTAVNDTIDNWAATPSIQRIALPDGSQEFSIRGPVDLPPSVYNTPLSVDLASSITINQLVEILASKGITLVPISEERVQRGGATPSATARTADLTGLPDQDLVTTLQQSLELPGSIDLPGVGQRTFHIPPYNGTVGEYLEIVSALTDASFHSRGSLILVHPGVEYIIDLPQDQTLVERVASDLDSLGATNISASVDTGTIVFSAGSSKDQVLRDYMQRLKANNAMIGLQVAVVTVSHQRERNSGLDWSSLQATLGDAINASESYLSSALTDSTLEIVFERGEFSLTGLVNFLSRYGVTETKQNLVLRTLSANPVKIRSGRSTPYIAEVRTSSSGDVVSGGTTTDTADTGLEVEILPYYNHHVDLVTMAVDIRMSTLLAFLELEAGNQIGTLTQPDIQEQLFSNTARLRAGETVVLGGLTYDEDTNNYNTLTPLERLPVAGQRAQRNQNSLFIVLRPTVTLYE